MAHSAPESQENQPVFPPTYRGSGVLLHLTSLPSAYGIGDLGPEAFAWVGRLADARQGWWQVLPLGPPGKGDSPYDPLSTFAGNELLISPDVLIEDGLLVSDEVAAPSFPNDAVDFPAVAAFKQRLLERAHASFLTEHKSDLRQRFDEFCQEQAHWLDDYALFRALRLRYKGADYHDWPADLVHREPAALTRARQELQPVVDQFRFSQFVFFRQAERLKSHAHAKGLRLLGDVPFFVSPDSCDVWANPDVFLLDRERRPAVVAGVPPDYFSADGQLWGNPVYDWDALRSAGYQWWIERLQDVLSQTDLVRMDHFRAFAAAWHIPADSTTATVGEWSPGPGAELFETIRAALGRLPFIAEDLGMITADVLALRDQFDLPGMRVLQFAFDGDPRNFFLPENYIANTVVYTGTHDNDTSRGWYESLAEDQRSGVWKALKRPPVDTENAAWALIDTAWSSKAALAMTPLQDLLNLGAEARMNVPGHPVGNWRWRCTKERLQPPVFERLHELTMKTGRAADPASRPQIRGGS